MTVVGARIDNRLLHGMVATNWAPQSGATRVMVIDDKVALDPVLKETMKMGRPAGMAVSIITLSKAINNFSTGKYDNQKVFIVSKTPEVFLELQEKGVSLPELVLGGTFTPENTDGFIQASKRAYVSKNQIATYKKLLSNGTLIKVMYTPNDREVKLTDVFSTNKV